MTFKELEIAHNSIFMLYNAIHENDVDNDSINDYIESFINETIECGEMLDSTMAIMDNAFEERFLKSLLNL